MQISSTLLYQKIASRYNRYNTKKSSGDKDTTAFMSDKSKTVGL